MKLTPERRDAIEQEINALTENTLELERKAQRLQRILDRDDTEAGRAALASEEKP